MMLSRKNAMKTLMVAGALALSFPAVTLAGPKYAVIPTETIFPGDVISQGLVTQVEVTNPNIAPGYASSFDEVVGKVSKRTLVAGRTIMTNVLQEPYTVKRGTTVRLTFSANHMVIAARGAPMDDAMAGAVIKVRNLDTGVMVSGTVMTDGSVEVVQR